MPVNELENALKSALNAEHVQIEDNSWRHAGHAEMAGKATLGQLTHIRVVIVSSQFEGVPLLDRHRQVHGALKSAFETHLHALELKPYTPVEFAALSLDSATP